VIVPNGGALRIEQRAQGVAEILVEDQKLDAVVELPLDSYSHTQLSHTLGTHLEQSAPDGRRCYGTLHLNTLAGMPGDIRQIWGIVMFEGGLNVVRLALVAVVGALILEVVVTFSVGYRHAFTLDQIPSHLAALLVGSMGGWLFELFREQSMATNESLRNVRALQTSVEALTTKITYQDEALSMLIECPRHNDALTALIKASMSENFRNIPLVGVPRYLDLLGRAIDHSDRYEGIQRKPFRWYKETGAGSYLTDLRDRPMRLKLRLVLVDVSDLDDMREDLEDEEVMRYYWNHTGDVQTYWMTVSEFREHFPQRRVPSDMALYDRQLWFAYDERNQMLTFDVLSEEATDCKLFDAVSNMARHGVTALKPVVPATIG
jgi:hypothetical protein